MRLVGGAGGGCLRRAGRADQGVGYKRRRNCERPFHVVGEHRPRTWFYIRRQSGSCTDSILHSGACCQFPDGRTRVVLGVVLDGEDRAKLRRLGARAEQSRRSAGKRLRCPTDQTADKRADLGVNRDVQFTLFADLFLNTLAEFRVSRLSLDGGDTFRR